MSFFDDEPDEPTRVSRPARPRRATSRSSAAHAPDPAIARRRQLALFGGLAVIAILLIVTVQSCAGTRHRNALKDYNRNVTSIVQSSDDQVSRQLFQVLSSGGQANDVQVAVNQVRLVAEEDVRRAKALSVPGDMSAAQRYLELVLNLRADSVQKIAEDLPKAMSNQPSAPDAIRHVAGEMQAFLASDVVYSQRVAPLIEQKLDDNGVHGETIASSKFLPNLGWLDPGQVGTRINPDAGVSSGTANGKAAPGTHGHGLISVQAGGVTLQPGTIVNRLPAGSGLAFDVTLANQGENDESNVGVEVKITGGGKPIDVTKRLNQTKAGQNATVTIQVGTTPPKGTSAQVTVTIKPVLGEKKTDNNTGTYTVLFT